MKRFSYISSLIIFLLCSSNTFAQADNGYVTTIEVTDSSDTIIGWAHLYDREGEPTQRSNSQLIYLPGFEIEVEVDDPADDEEEIIPGTRDSADDILSRLLAENGQPALNHFINIENYPVWIIEYFDPDAKIQVNAQILRNFLLTTSNDAETPKSLFESSGVRSFVMGFSMGGLVARYALTQMEHDNLDHYTSAYVSLDSPHSGAFLPPSLEVFARTVPSLASGKPYSSRWGKLRRSAEVFNAKYETDAAKQLLGLYVNMGASGEIGFFWDWHARWTSMNENIENASHPLYHELRSELDLLGSFPEHMVNIGVTHGILQGGRIDWLEHTDPQGQTFYYPPELSGKNMMAAKAVDFAGNVTKYTLNFNHPGYERATAKLCYFHLNFTRRDCLPVLMPRPLRYVNNVAGSYTNAFSKFAEELNKENEDSAVANDNNGFNTFVPSTSALAMGYAKHHLAVNFNQELSPFDIIVGNSFDVSAFSFGNFPHTVVSNSVRDDILNALTNVEVNRLTASNPIIIGDGIPTVDTDMAQIVLSNGNHLSVQDAMVLANMQSNLPTELNLTIDPVETLMMDKINEAAALGSTRLLEIETVNFTASVL